MAVVDSAASTAAISTLETWMTVVTSATNSQIDPVRTNRLNRVDEILAGFQLAVWFFMTFAVNKQHPPFVAAYFAALVHYGVPMVSKTKWPGAFHTLRGIPASREVGRVIATATALIVAATKHIKFAGCAWVPYSDWSLYCELFRISLRGMPQFDILTHIDYGYSSNDLDPKKMAYLQKALASVLQTRIDLRASIAAIANAVPVPLLRHERLTRDRRRFYAFVSAVAFVMWIICQR
jgi:hypothetical protein